MTRGNANCRALMARLREERLGTIALPDDLAASIRKLPDLEPTSNRGDEPRRLARVLKIVVALSLGLLVLVATLMYEMVRRLPIGAGILVLALLSSCETDLDETVDASATADAVTAPAPIDAEASPADVGDPSWPACWAAWPPSPPIVYCGQLSGTNCYEMALAGVQDRGDEPPVPWIPCRGPGEVVLFPEAVSCAACARLIGG